MKVTLLTSYAINKMCIVTEYMHLDMISLAFFSLNIFPDVNFKMT